MWQELESDKSDTLQTFGSYDKEIHIPSPFSPPPSSHSVQASTWPDQMPFIIPQCTSYIATH